jgi:hypothetical protein
MREPWRRTQIAQKVPSGEWGVELETYEADTECERQRTLAAYTRRWLAAGD